MPMAGISDLSIFMYLYVLLLDAALLMSAVFHMSKPFILPCIAAMVCIRIAGGVRRKRNMNRAPERNHLPL